MSKPPTVFNAPDFSGQTKILYVNEGNNLAMLQTNTAGRRNVGGMKVASAQAALAWCRKHKAIMVYMPAIDVTGN
jgi:hypothetical protein